MINELHSLAEIGIPSGADHQTRRNLPGGDCYRIWLNNSGEVAGAELLPVDLVKSLSKFGDNQATFPAFNIAPLYRIASDEDKKIVADIGRGNGKADLKALKALCVSDNWGKKRINQVNDCLHRKFPGMGRCKVMDDLLRLCQATEAAAFRTSLEKLVWEKLNAKEDIALCLSLLIHKGSLKKNNKPEDDSGSLSIILDICDWEKHGNPVANKDTANLMNEILLHADNETVMDKTTSKAHDAFGAAYSGVGKPMPSVRIASGFDVTLRAMFREQHCQFRYQNADDKSYPITLENRRIVQTALKWISETERDGVMWEKIDKAAVLFVYPDKLPSTIPKFAALFNKASEDKIARFEDVAGEFIKTLKGIPPKERPKNIHIFTLRQIPPALSKRAKVDLSHSLTTDALITAAEDWKNGFANIPPNDRVESDTLYPLQVYKFLNQVWNQDGTTKKSVPQMRYYQGMEVLLNICKRMQLSYHLRELLANSEGLVVFAGNRLPRAKLTARHKDVLSKLIPLLGLFLYKLDCKKDDYMENSSFLLGQILKISDSLHALYCKIKRDGDIPTQLVGNAAFVTACENPLQALALLGTRMCPYISWAKKLAWSEHLTEKERENSGLALWHLRLYEDSMSKLRLQITSDLRYSDIDKAQLFIGYLANFLGDKKGAQADDETPATKEEGKDNE